jgi:hypothetical protein
VGAAQAEDEGLEPTKEWVKDLVDEVIADEFGSPDLELLWLDEDSGAAEIEAQFEARVKIGAATLNELRDALGLDRFANPAADRPMVLTPTGYVPIEAGAGGGNASSPPGGAGQGANAQAAPAVQKYNPDQPRVPAGSPHGGEWTSEGGGGPSGGSQPDGAPASHGQPERGPQYAALETGTQTDASHAPNGSGSSGGAEPDGGAVSHGEPERGPQYAQTGTAVDPAEGAPHATIIGAVALNRTTVIYTYSDGSQDIYSGGSISWRNNNPGNMHGGAGGIYPVGYNGPNAIFADYQTGFDAMVANLMRPIYQVLTIGEAIAKWAPRAGGNDPVTYANNLHAWTGLPLDMPMNVLTDAQINAVATAIQRQEGWVVGTITHIPPPAEPAPMQ